MKRVFLNLLVLLAVASVGYAQKNVMWEPVNISSMDLFRGPGGDEMRPDLSNIEFIKEEKGGHNRAGQRPQANAFLQQRLLVAWTQKRSVCSR